MLGKWFPCSRGLVLCFVTGIPGWAALGQGLESWIPGFTGQVQNLANEIPGWAALSQTLESGMPGLTAQAQNLANEIPGWAALGQDLDSRIPGGDGNQTRVACIVGQHSSKELFEQLTCSAIQILYMTAPLHMAITHGIIPGEQARMQTNRY